MAGFKVDRLETEFLRAISSIIRNDVKNKDLSLVTITQVKLTKDLNQAKIYFTSLGGEAKVNSDLNALNQASGFIKKELGLKVKMRRIPDLLFIPDETLNYSNKIERLLKSTK